MDIPVVLSRLHPNLYWGSNATSHNTYEEFLATWPEENGTPPTEAAMLADWELNGYSNLDWINNQERQAADPVLVSLNEDGCEPNVTTLCEVSTTTTTTTTTTSTTTTPAPIGCYALNRYLLPLKGLGLFETDVKCLMLEHREGTVNGHCAWRGSHTYPHYTGDSYPRINADLYWDDYAYYDAINGVFIADWAIHVRYYVSDGASDLPGNQTGWFGLDGTYSGETDFTGMGNALFNTIKPATIFNLEVPTAWTWPNQIELYAVDNDYDPNDFNTDVEGCGCPEAADLNIQHGEIQVLDGTGSPIYTLPAGIKNLFGHKTQRTNDQWCFYNSETVVLFGGGLRIYWTAYNTGNRWWVSFNVSSYDGSLVRLEGSVDYLACTITNLIVPVTYYGSLPFNFITGPSEFKLTTVIP